MEKKLLSWKKYNDKLEKGAYILFNSLWIPKLKQELEEIRRTGDLSRISDKELEIARKIQQAVGEFPYNPEVNNPSEILTKQLVNCVGSSILGWALLEELGIKYLHVSLIEHSATLLITSDSRVYWQDFTPGGLQWNYQEITSDMIDTKGSISDFALNSEDFSMCITFRSWNPYSYIQGRLKVNILRPEIGLQCHLLNNNWNKLWNYRDEEAIEALKQAISLSPKLPDPYNWLWSILRCFGRYEEAIEAFRQVINLDPEYIDSYIELWKTLNNLGKFNQAIEAFKQAINLDPEFADSYNGLWNALKSLGKNKEAIEAFQTFIKLWNGDKFWIDRAKKIIKIQQIISLLKDTFSLHFFKLLQV